MLLARWKTRIRLIAAPDPDAAQSRIFFFLGPSEGLFFRSDMKDRAEDVDVVMMLRLQKERMMAALSPHERELLSKIWCWMLKNLAHAKADAIVMHNPAR